MPTPDIDPDAPVKDPAQTIDPMEVSDLGKDPRTGVKPPPHQVLVGGMSADAVLPGEACPEDRPATSEIHDGSFDTD